MSRFPIVTCKNCAILPQLFQTVLFGQFVFLKEVLINKNTLIFLSILYLKTITKMDLILTCLFFRTCWKIVDTDLLVLLKEHYFDYAIVSFLQRSLHNDDCVCCGEIHIADDMFFLQKIPWVYIPPFLCKGGPDASVTQHNKIFDCNFNLWLQLQIELSVFGYFSCFPLVSVMEGSLCLQAGGELTDFIIVLRTTEAVKTFCGYAHLSLGAGVSAAVGITGRAFEADLRAGDGGYAACYTYSCSKGTLFWVIRLSFKTVTIWFPGFRM